MARISTFMITMLVVLMVFFTSSMLFTDVNNSGGYTELSEFQTFNKTGQYASNLNNQSESMRTKLEQGSDNQGLDALTSLNLLLQGGSSVVVSALGLIDIALAMVYDIGTVLNIPVFFISLAIIGILIVIIAQITEGLRTGRM